MPAAIKAQYIHRPTLLSRATDGEQIGAGVVAGSVTGPDPHMTTQEEQEEVRYLSVANEIF